MDSTLIGAYRLIWTDIVLINDAIKTCYSMNCLSVKNVARALELIVMHEGDLLYAITSGLQEDTEDSRHVLEGNELSTESVVYVAWEFFHGVFLNFTIEELSQYPFWVAKSLSVVHPSPDYLAYALFGWMFKIGDMFATDGIFTVFKGVVPYLINRSVESYKHLEKSVRHFLDSAGRKLERTAASIDVSKIKEPSQYASRRSNSRAAESNNNKKKKLKKNEPEPEKSSYLRRLAVAAMCHPLLLQAVRLVTDGALTHRNWVLLYFSMLKSGGVQSLYKGLTTSIIFGLLPIPVAMYFGVVETVIYRRMAGQGSADRFGGGMSVLSSLLFEYTPYCASDRDSGVAALDMIPNCLHGVESILSFLFKPCHLVNIFKYGLMTMGQIIPGFCSFAISRILMSHTLGETPQRHREISIRKKILRDYLIEPPQLFLNKSIKRVSISSQHHAETQNMHTKKRGEYSGRDYSRQKSSGDSEFDSSAARENGRRDNFKAQALRRQGR